MNNPYQSLIQSQTFDAIPNQVPSILTQGTKNQKASTKPSITPPVGSAFNDGISFQDIMVNQLQQQQVVDSILNSVEPPNQSVTPTPEPTAVVSNTSKAAPTTLGSDSNIDVKKPYRDWDKTDKKLYQFYTGLNKAIKNKYGVELGVSETYRPQERQKWLYAQGRTRPGNIVTKTLNSRHTKGRAIDLLPPKDYKKLDDLIYFARDYAKDNGISYLGSWDPWHYQL